MFLKARRSTVECYLTRFKPVLYKPLLTHNECGFKITSYLSTSHETLKNLLGENYPYLSYIFQRPCLYFYYWGKQQSSGQF